MEKSLPLTQLLPRCLRFLSFKGVQILEKGCIPSVSEIFECPKCCICVPDMEVTPNSGFLKPFMASYNINYAQFPTYGLGTWGSNSRGVHAVGSKS
jgi:hypothetical protein